MLQQKKTVAELLHHAPAGFKPAATDSGVPQQHLEPRKHSPSLPKSSSHDSSAPNRFSEEEDHLLVFLKETKMKGWVEISRYFPNRKIHSLQSRYSQYLSKRDRMKDPPRVNLPPHIIAEAGLYHTGGEGFAHTPPPMKSKRDRPPHSSIGIIPDQVFQDQEDPSSSNDSVPRRGPVRPRARPRRAVQEVDYTWPRHGRRSGFDGEVLKDEELINGTSPSDEPDQEAPLGPELVIPIEQPIDVGFEREDARFALSLAQAPTASHQLPYLSSSQRSLARNGPQAGEWDLLVGRDWQSSTIHVDFTHDEMKAVELAICKVMLTTPFSNTGSRRKWIQKHLKGQPEHKLAKLCDKIRTRLPARESESVKAFLHDAQIGLLHSAPRVERLGAVRPNRKFSSAPRISTSSLIRQRELGLHSRRGWASASTPLSYQTKNAIFDTLGPAFSYTGASSDIHTVAWSPDGQCFAAGAVCVTDSDSMQYNRPNNLLYGDLEDKVIYELGEHYDQRLKVESGPNSTNAMFATQDSKLFYTVSSVAFSPRGEYMFSAGWDSHFHVWRTAEKGAQPELLSAMRHSAEIDVVTVSCKGQVATAAKKSKNSVKVITIEGWDPDSKEKPTLTSFTSRKARERPDLNILPTALQFEPQFGRMLLAGFSANKQQVDRMDMNGDICLWDVETQEELNVWGSTKSVFDVAFNSRQRDQPLFAVGCVAGMNVNKGTRSVVRFFDGRAHERYTTRLELECPALDMNELKFCPFDENLVASGCTSGSTYVWDIRNPDSWLYELSHGRSLMPLDDEIDWEITDTGVRLLSWGDNATRLYTGSSDGTVKVWDVARSPEDVFVKDIITFNSGVMSGAFSPDHSRLIVGEVDGSVTVLEVSRDDYTLKDTEKLAFIPYDEPEDPHSAPAEQPESGITEAIRLVGNEQIRYAPLGGLPIRQALQGLNYDGPYDQSVEAPYLREQAFEFQLKLAEEPDPQCTIPLCRDGINKITSEDIGDSGRSRDRIPDELRKQWNMIGSNLTVTSGKSKCAECGRPARPLNSTAELRQRILCERCSFDCFRCGTANTIHPETRLLICKTCKCSWEIGALGYQCVKDSGTYNRLTSIASLKKYEEDLLLARGEPQGDATMGDELNALTDYYHSLAIDRPVLPI
ncbi:WD40 repeat-like protein [Polyplosphaeria fusca]|uniref:WD40 repeat-like protein n=1 Tax=Polyplosphaeria fusca TaxID=682080 RepID=A0A9P4UZS0_9PLEO|nr:WD40 repeat-like protein [Polyplosphaeria fusca]